MFTRTRHPATMTADEIRALRLANVPRDQRDTCQRVRARIGSAEALLWIDASGRPCAAGFLGRSCKHFARGSSPGTYTHSRFRDQAQRRAYVADLIATAGRIDAHHTSRRDQQRAMRAQGHGLAVGDVLRATWGYEQTNIDWYQVTALIGSTMVEVRKIAGQCSSDLHMQGDTAPAVGHFTGPPTRHRVSGSGEHASVKISSCQQAHKVQPSTVVAGVALYAPARWTGYA